MSSKIYIKKDFSLSVCRYGPVQFVCYYALGDISPREKYNWWPPQTNKRWRCGGGCKIKKDTQLNKSPLMYLTIITLFSHQFINPALHLNSPHVTLHNHIHTHTYQYLETRNIGVTAGPYTYMDLYMREASNLYLTYSIISIPLYKKLCQNGLFVKGKLMPIKMVY